MPFLLTLSQLIYGRYADNRTLGLDDAAFALFSVWVTPKMDEDEIQQLCEKSFTVAELWLKKRNQLIAPL